MQIFCAWKWKKQYILYGIAVIALVIGGIHFLPPAAEQVSVILQAETKKELPIYCVETDEKKVAISFDAAWGADDTDDLLSILDEYDVTATFFLCGYWVEKYPEEVEKIAEAGHDLGNHSATHPHMSQLSAEQITKELQQCHAEVKELTGIDMNLFRPPFGEYNDTVIQTARENGYYSIQWDVETLATKKQEKRDKKIPFFYFKITSTWSGNTSTFSNIEWAISLLSSIDMEYQSSAEKGIMSMACASAMIVLYFAKSKSFS